MLSLGDQVNSTGNCFNNDYSLGPVLMLIHCGDCIHDHSQCFNLSKGITPGILNTIYRVVSLIYLEMSLMTPKRTPGNFI